MLLNHHKKCSKIYILDESKGESGAIHAKFVIESSAIRHKNGAIRIILANLNGAIHNPKCASKGALC